MKLLPLLFSLALVACASAPASVPDKSADRAASSAAKMVGKPYKYGGTSPAGFDCSGLILFSYRQAGIALPRETADLRRASHPVKLADLRRGDLIFFDQRGQRNSHVAIYVGDRRFVHAPSSGKHVRSDTLDNPYWKKHLSEVRRIGA